MSLITKPTPVTSAISVTGVLIAARVVNRLGGAGMAFLGVRLTRDLGVPVATTGMILAVFGVATIPSRVLGGVVTTRWGPRAALVGGLVASGLAQAVIAAGSSLPVVAAGVLLLGLAYEVIEPATQTAVVTGVAPERRASRFSVLWAAVSLAGVVAGVIAAVVTRWGVGALFAVDAATSLLAAALVATLLPVLPTVRVERAWRAALHRRLLAWTALCCVPTTVVMVVVFMLPLVVERAGRPPSTTAWLLVAAAASALVAQRALARVEVGVPARVVLAVGYLLLAVALAVWAVGSLPALVVGAVLEGAAGSLVVGTQQAVASRLAPVGSEAAAMTIQGLSWGVATVVAPVVGAALLEVGERTLWLTCAAVAAVLATGHAVGARPSCPGKRRSVPRSRGDRIGRWASRRSRTSCTRSRRRTSPRRATPG